MQSREVDITPLLSFEQEDLFIICFLIRILVLFLFFVKLHICLIPANRRNLKQ